MNSVLIATVVAVPMAMLLPVVLLLWAEVKELRKRLAAAEADAAAEREKVRVLREAMNRIIDYAGSLDSALIMCDKALAATAPEGG